MTQFSTAPTSARVKAHVQLSVVSDMMPIVVSKAVTPDCCPAPNLLIISDSEQPHAAVRNLLGPTGCNVSSVFTWKDAIRLLRVRDFAVVLTEDRITDGSWRYVLDFSHGLVSAPRVVVFSRLAGDGLWAEVLNLGAYDLLMYPFEGDELTRVTWLAAESWKRERQSGSPITPKRPRVATASAAGISSSWLENAI